MSDKDNKIVVVLDFTNLNKPASQVIAESKANLALLEAKVTEFKEEIVDEIANNPKVLNNQKKVRWYNKLWNAVKSLF